MNKDFVSIADYSREEIEAIFDLTKELKDKTKAREESPSGAGQAEKINNLKLCVLSVSALKRICKNTNKAVLLKFQLAGSKTEVLQQ